MIQIQTLLCSLRKVIILMLFVAPVYGDHSEVYGDLNTDKGKMLYDTTCVACHGQDGKSPIPGIPNFKATDSRLVQKDHLTLLQHISEGFQSPGSAMAMPAKGGNPGLSEQDIACILEYMLMTFASAE